MTRLKPHLKSKFSYLKNNESSSACHPRNTRRAGPKPRESIVSRFQFDDVSEQNSWTERSTDLTHIIVRAFGFLLMIVGLWIGLKAINEAWGLYKEPQNIERFALAIEKGSNLDKSLSSIQGSSKANTEGTNSQSESVLGFRLSYFAAWMLAILLLMLVGRLALAAVKTGGELALYDMQIKKFAKLLAQESRK